MTPIPGLFSPVGPGQCILGCSGYICISLPAERLEALEVPMMVAQNEDPHRTAYTVTVDYKYSTQSICIARSHLSLTAHVDRHDDWHLCTRSGSHRPRARRLALATRILFAPGTPRTTSRTPRRRPHTAGTHRVWRRPVRSYGPPPRGRPLRACQRGRAGHHDAARRTEGVCGPVGTQDDQCRDDQAVEDVD